MEDLLKESADIVLPQVWSLVKWTVLTINKSQVIVDVDWVNLWIIAWRELNDSFNTAKDIKVWDDVSAVVLEDENEDWVLILSVRKAWQFNTWDRLKKARSSWEVVIVSPSLANKWWLLVDIDWIKWFIPVSQLAPEHYPRVENSDTNKIFQKLQKLVWVSLSVCVINVDETTWKVVLSEKEARKWDQDVTLKWLEIWSVINWKVTWVSKFWFFVTFNDLEWLVHISEIAWWHVSDPSKYAKVWDKIDVKVIWIEWNKVSLSLKRMHDDPWVTLTQKYVIWDTVKWVINKVSEFWAFVSLQEDVNGLIHLSEIEEWASDARKYFSVWQEVEAVVIEINPDEHRIALSVKWMLKKIKKSDAKKPAKDEKNELKDENEVKEVKKKELKKDAKEENVKDDKKKDKKTEKKEEKKAEKVKKDAKKEDKKEEKKTVKKVEKKVKKVKKEKKEEKK